MLGIFIGLTISLLFFAGVGILIGALLREVLRFAP
jgi:hypothetical protein